MKKIIVMMLAVIMAFAMTFGFAACGNDTPEGPDDQTQTPGDPDKPDDPTTEGYSYDIVVYGDTAAAVAAAVSASRESERVALVAPAVQLGGMLSGGLSATDLGDASVIGGFAREFFKRNAVKKGKTDGSVDWYAEPHVAEDILEEMLEETQATEYGVDIYRGERLEEGNGVVMNGNTIEKIVCESGKVFEADQFIDASYEGDLMAQAGVSYTVGRESSAAYGESLAGVVAPSIAGANNHQFNYQITPYDEDGELYAEVSEEPIAANGTGDEKVQAYNYRMCLTANKDNQLPFPKPENYDADRYGLLLKYIKEWEKQRGSAPNVGDLFIMVNIQGTDKYDFNNRGAFSTDYIGGSYGYPDGTYAEREQIIQDHYDYTAGLFWFLVNDERVPASTRASVGAWGLAADEFEATDGWPFQLYVREGRRMIGEYVMTQKDIEKNSSSRVKDDAIGMGSYNSDSHNVQRYVTPEGYVRNEGNMEVPVSPYDIPYRMILPKEEESDNLLVVCTFSASHVAYSSIRMEAQYMIIGQAAGIAASMAVAGNTGVHEISVPQLQETLIDYGGIFRGSMIEEPTEGVILEDDFSDYTEKWGISEGNNKNVAPIITQNDGTVNIKKPGIGYCFISNSTTDLPRGAFTYSFRAKINSTLDAERSVAEFTIRAAEYSVIVVLAYNSAQDLGSVCDAYDSPAGKYMVDTNEWHDYVVTVYDDYTYGLYVDGTLVWDGAPAKAGGSQLIKIGSSQNGEKGAGFSDFEVDSFRLEYGLHAPQA